MAASQELAIFIATLIVGAVLLVLATRPRAGAFVPPTVAPMAHPFDEDVRALKHRVSNLEQIIQMQTERIGKQEAMFAAMREDHRQLMGGVHRMERQLDMLVENGLRGERS